MLTSRNQESGGISRLVTQRCMILKPPSTTSTAQGQPGSRTSPIPWSTVDLGHDPVFVLVDKMCAVDFCATK